MTRRHNERPSRNWRHLVACYSAARFALVTLVCWLALPTSVWAQAGQPLNPVKSLANQYIILLGLIGLAIFVVCKPAKRAEKPKRKM